MPCKCFPISIHEKKEKQDRDSHFTPAILAFSAVKPRPHTRQGAQGDKERRRIPHSSHTRNCEDPTQFPSEQLPGSPEIPLREELRGTGGSANRARSPNPGLRLPTSSRRRARSSCFTSFSTARARSRSLPKNSLVTSMAASGASAARTRRPRGGLEGDPGRAARAALGLQTAASASPIGAAGPRPARRFSREPRAPPAAISAPPPPELPGEWGWDGSGVRGSRVPADPAASLLNRTREWGTGTVQLHRGTGWGGLAALLVVP